MLNEQLFVRLNREIQLTEAGESLLPGLSRVFSELSAVMLNFKKRDENRVLTITTPISVALKWLIPRLSRFKKLHPNINIRIDSNNGLVNLNHHDIDIGIRYGTGDYPDLHVVPLAKTANMFPVCSPGLLEEGYPLTCPEDLVNFTLLDQPIVSDRTMWPDWDLWLELVGCPGIEGYEREQFDQPLMAMQAAAEGQGVALVDEVIAGDELTSGKLVKPFELSYPLPFAYYIVCPKHIVDQPNVRAFTEWAQQELSA
jgi:LysR family transcriptional regulator, glycine cleavage system transcriptional activator